MTFSQLPLGVLVVSFFCSSVNAGLEHTCNADQYYNRRSSGSDDVKCGRNLADFLMDVLCVNGMAKRSYPDDIFQIPSKANSFLKPSKRGSGTQQGIVCECCLNRCSMDEMFEYCLDGKRKRSGLSLRGMMERRSGSSAASKEESASKVYEIIEAKADGPPITIDELMSDPMVQQLEWQKVLNSQQQPQDKRMFNEAENERLSPQERYSQMKNYLKGKLSKMFADGSISERMEALRASPSKYNLEEILKLIETD